MPTKKKAPASKKKKIPVKNLTPKKAETKKEEPDFAKNVSEKLSKPKLAPQSKKIETKKTEPKSKKEVKKVKKVKTGSNVYRNISLGFIFATIILLGLIFYFSIVRLTITIIPNEERLTDSVSFSVYNKDQAATVSSKDAVLGVVEQIELTEEKSYTSSGVEVIGEEVVGNVTIINNYSKNQPLVATTRLLNEDGKLYRLKNTVNVPAGGSVEAEVYADEPKSEMAIGPSKFTIPGLWSGLQDKIYAESKTKFSYQQQTKKYIQQVDIDKGVADMKKALVEKAKNKLGDSYKGYDQVLYKVDETSVSTEVEGKVGEEKDKLSIKMTTNVIVVAFSAESIAELAQSQLSVIVPDNKELINFSSNEISYTLEDANAKQGIAKVSAEFSGAMTIKDGKSIIDPNKIIGLTKDQLEDYLDNFEEISGYDIRFNPAFIDKVPKLIDRINIEVE